MRLMCLAAAAALTLSACDQPDATVDEQAPATVDPATTNADASADAAAAAAAADASSVTSVDESVGP